MWFCDFNMVLKKRKQKKTITEKKRKQELAK